MIYHGRNLMLSVDGVVIAGAKSCTLDVDVSTVKVSSPTDADWEHIKPRIKKWSVSTEHLLKSNPLPVYTVKAVGTSLNGTTTDQSYCEINGNRYTGGTRGLQLRIFEWDSDASRWASKSVATYDTYASEQAVTDMCADLEDDASAGDLIVITSNDACAITSALATAIETALGLPTGSVPVFEATRASFVAIGKYHDKGISFCNKDSGSTVHATLYLNSLLDVITSSPIRSGAMMVGKSCTLRLNVDGFPADMLTGNAIITSFKTSGTVGSLMAGKFSFKGDGPLE
jgi:hypothetical protein